MTGRDFCYWLQGYFEIAENESDEIQDVKLSDKQVKVIRAHLNLVFKHEIDPSNLDGKSSLEQKEYQMIHDGAKSGDELKDPYSHSLDEVFPEHSQVTFNC
jgi:hypothetical protein